MASLLGHSLVAVTAGKSLRCFKNQRWVLVAGALCSVLPDADVLAFAFGLPYAHPFGHRGFTHSIFFSVFLGLAISTLFFRVRALSRDWLVTACYLIFCTLSHALLDAMTNGGLGVAFFSPFENSRYFLPWRPIQVSPIGISAFFSEWGVRVMLSEAIWIGIPWALLLMMKNFFYPQNES